MKRFINVKQPFSLASLRHRHGVILALTALLLCIAASLAGSLAWRIPSFSIMPSLSNQVLPTINKEATQKSWIYVLDSNRNRTQSQVLVVDAEQGRILRTFKAGYIPDMALSPDGKRLYLASRLYTPNANGPKLRGVLQIIDTETGTVLKTVDNHNLSQPPFWRYRSVMTISPDGKWLYIFKHSVSREGDFYFVETFDTEQGRFLPEKPNFPYCFNAVLFPGEKPRTLNVMCTGTKEVWFLEVNERGAASTSAMPLLELQPAQTGPRRERNQHALHVGPVFLSRDGSTFTAIMGDGRCARIDNKSHNVIQIDAIDNAARRIASNPADDWMSDSWLQFQNPPLSPDGEKVYLGIGRRAHFRYGVWMFDRIAVLNSRTLEKLDIIKPSQMFWSLALSKDGKHLYAISPEQSSIMVIDTATRRQIRTIYEIGETPIQAIVAP